MNNLKRRVLETVQRHWEPPGAAAVTVIDALVPLFEELLSSLTGADGRELLVLANPLGLLFRGVLGDPSVIHWQRYAYPAIQAAASFRERLAINVPDDREGSYARGFTRHSMLTFLDTAALLAALRLRASPSSITDLLHSVGVYDFDNTWPSDLEKVQQSHSRDANVWDSTSPGSFATREPHGAGELLQELSATIQRYHFYYAEFFMLGSVYLMRLPVPDIQGAIRLLDTALLFPQTVCAHCQNCRPYSAAKSLSAIYSRFNCSAMSLAKPQSSDDQDHPPSSYDQDHHLLVSTLTQFDSAIDAWQLTEATKLIETLLNDPPAQLGQWARQYVFEALHQLNTMIPYLVLCRIAKSVSRLPRDRLLEQLGMMDTPIALEELAKQVATDSDFYPVQMQLKGPIVCLSDPAIPKHDVASVCNMNVAYNQLRETLQTLESQTWKADLTQLEVAISVPAIQAIVSNQSSDLV